MRHGSSGSSSDDANAPAQVAPDAGLPSGAAEPTRGGDGPEAIAALLSAASLLAAGASGISRTSGLVFLALLLGTAGAYAMRNPLRHAASAGLLWGIGCMLAPVAYLNAGGMVLSDGWAIRLAVNGPYLGLAVIVVVDLFGIIAWLRRGTGGAFRDRPRN